MLEPLSEALDVTLLELMHSQLDTNVSYSKEEVDEILAQTIQISVAEKLKESKKKTITIIISVVMFLVVLFLLMTGL